MRKEIDEVGTMAVGQLCRNTWRCSEGNPDRVTDSFCLGGLPGASQQSPQAVSSNARAAAIQGNARL
jgi:hypothetical protein